MLIHLRDFLFGKDVLSERITSSTSLDFSFWMAPSHCWWRGAKWRCTSLPLSVWVNFILSIYNVVGNGHLFDMDINIWPHIDEFWFSSSVWYLSQDYDRYVIIWNWGSLSGLSPLVRNEVGYHICMFESWTDAWLLKWPEIIIGALTMLFCLAVYFHRVWTSLYLAVCF